MPTESLEEAKQRLSRYLGRAGIHGVGLRRSENAVMVYLDPAGGEDCQALLREMEREVAPFRLMAVYEGRPRIT